ncbi:Nuclear receptor subfamily 0 group B member 1 Nuclear receptor DAX-1 [Larimichthys crocea]|uniref:Nuclear receptor subfamily 0 group B member 1 Nuclear receptor DAX-1 n=1 Tax=Larimichthys crocea TaxID=215358 RepID=A0A0F8ABP5_LARCR|nr:nuclear receptor subfamily 0 group B member 1 [Larimichthys crocea]KAE8278482.1 Nuclear receptor subfamily 0 group B member 1 Nuclear receptor DAX-1 [Larimichthys crocea]
MSCCECADREDAARGSILYSILNRGARCPQGLAETAAAHQLCSCSSKRKLVALRAPRLVFKAASEVLVKTFRFVKNVPCFRGLPAEDQLRLVRNSWAPLLVLGMVQDSVDFDTVETQQPSLLHTILTHSRERQQWIQDPGVPVSDAEGIKRFLVRCRGLRISVKEYAFLKGAILFTPEVTELECRDYIQALHREAERALYEHVRTVHRGRAGRFGRLRQVLNALRSMDPDAVAGLFFRPVTGTRSIDEHVLGMFYERQNPK